MIRALRGSVPFDAAWWWTIDPANTRFTSGVFEPMPTGHSTCGGLHTNEFGDTDYNKFRVLGPGRSDSTLAEGRRVALLGPVMSEADFAARRARLSAVCPGWHG